MRNIILLNIGIGLVLLVVFTTTSLPGETIFWNAMQNAGHGLAMCFAAFISISSTAWKSPQHTRVIYITAPLVLFALGTLIEVVQHLTGRGASLGDIALNTTGIVAGMCFSTVSVVRIRLLVKLVCVGLGILLITWCVRKPTYLLANKWLSPTLPVIAHFDNFAADARIQHSHTTFNIGNHQAAWPASQGKSMKVTYYPARWPYVRIVEMVHDWSNYTALALEVYNTQANEIKLNIRVDYQPETSSNRGYMIARRVVQPGHSSISVPLEELLQEFYETEPNLTKITRVMLYLASPENNVTLYFDNLRLH